MNRDYLVTALGNLFQEGRIVILRGKLDEAIKNEFSLINTEDIGAVDCDGNPVNMLDLTGKECVMISLDSSDYFNEADNILAFYCRNPLEVIITPRTYSGSINECLSQYFIVDFDNNKQIRMELWEGSYVVIESVDLVSVVLN